ncbi:hypothetical protein Vretimale_3675 [Volvox reticuliferus]|uniref:Uncharacterized protein n=1 Tax=Volvox reticuliferus TaxID=1737510 RepID=A0A8J4FDL3_9CHLO|nr:hypothetical protein Vretifemale_1278 [Volvox reticuliferus]GIL98267.1 hypothetical protein Vretimale_3675 [Volvox reticuliferus]
MLIRVGYYSLSQFAKQALGLADHVYQQYRKRYPPTFEVFRKMHFSAAPTNVLASRASPAAVCVLPATAVAAVVSRHGASFQPSSCTNHFCSRCSSAACAAIATHTCSSSSGSSSSSSNRRTSGSGCRVHGLPAAVRNPLRTSAAFSTATPYLPAPDSRASGGASAIGDPSAYQSLSLLILLYECTRRAYGSPLLETDDLLSLPAQMDSLPCCVVLLVPEDSQPLQYRAHGSPSASTSTSPPNLMRPASTLPSPSAADTSMVVNHSTEYGEERHLGTSSLGITTAAVSSSCNNNTSSGNYSSSSSSSSGAGELLRVQYLNLAATEALKARAKMEDGSRDHWMEVAGLDAETLRTMSRVRGSPQKREMCALTLTLKSAPASRPIESSGGCGVCGSVSAAAAEHTIHCPEALLLPLMSPNGACAGIAVMFEKWEVRGTAGQVELEGRPLVPEIRPDSAPGDGELSQLQERVRAQADVVRKLKTQQGLNNKDPLVIAAVAALQQLKAELNLQERLNRAFSGAVSVLRPLLHHQQQQQQRL